MQNTCVCYECRKVLYVPYAQEHRDGWYTCKGQCAEEYTLRRMRENEGCSMELSDDAV